ncbi:MAG TPA: oligoribonuclease [Desulfobacteraceae bacterium]|nr:oligoribonuclease [Desulfobacteraceae bacterium]HPJ66794.1 oligoribonuclease [Desulfobacteraceae bacterium]HPQ27004.1 oligoribonuclease [Desulfobacteraceae bacterium]
MELELDSHLIWIDLEMTGLDPENHVILEIACIITSNSLEIIAEGPDIPIKHPEHILSLMDSWSRKHHQLSGLLHRAKTSPYNCNQAEDAILDFVTKYCKKGQSPLCGNSIWQDRRFLIKYMPRLEDFLNYRNIDVSSIKELAKRWYPALPRFKKQKQHQAMEDIRESLNELKFYRQHIFMDNADITHIQQV